MIWDNNIFMQLLFPEPRRNIFLKMWITKIKRGMRENMKTWKLVSGILSIIFAAILFVEGITGHMNILKSVRMSASLAILSAVFLITAGIVSIVVRKGKIGGGIAAIVLYLCAVLFGIPASHGMQFYDPLVFSAWSFVCAIIASIDLIAQGFRKRRKPDRAQNEAVVQEKERRRESTVYTVIIAAGVALLVSVIVLAISKSA